MAPVPFGIFAFEMASDVGCTGEAPEPVRFEPVTSEPPESFMAEVLHSGFPAGGLIIDLAELIGDLGTTTGAITSATELFLLDLLLIKVDGKHLMPSSPETFAIASMDVATFASLTVLWPPTLEQSSGSETAKPLIALPTPCLPMCDDCFCDFCTE